LANQNGRPIAPARKLVAAVLGTIAIFVMVFGLGLTSWAIVVLGLAVLALSIALGMVNVVRRGARAWISGTAQVKAVSEPPASSAYGRAELQLVVIAPGLPITEVLVRDPRVPVEKWPRPGETLPIRVDVDDMRRVRIDWPNAADRADPPPPGQSYAETAYTDPVDEYDDDLLGEPEPPPWAAAAGSQWDAEEPSPGDLDQIVVHDTPGGPVVDGQVVGHDESAAPLPRRPGTGPIPSPTDPPRPAAARPSPRPRAGAQATPAGAATATVEPETAWSDPGGTARQSPEAAPPPAPGSPAPEPRPAPDDTTEAAAAAPEPGPRPASYDEPRDTSDDEPRDTSDDEPRDTSDDEPRGAWHDEPRGAWHDQPRGAWHDQPRGAWHDEPRDASQAESGAAADADAALEAESRAASEAESGGASRAEAAGAHVAEPFADVRPGAAPTAAAASAPLTVSDDDIDLPLDENPETPPEDTAAAEPAVAHGLVAPPPTVVSHFIPPPREKPAAGPEPTVPPQAPPPPDESTAGEPTAGEPGAGESEAAESRAAESGAAESAAAESAAAESAAAEPAAAESGAAESGAAESAAAESAAAESAAGEPGAGEPAAAEPAAEMPAVAPAAGTRGSAWSDLEGGYEPDDRADEVITAYPSARPGPAGAIHGVGLTVLVTDLNRAVDFYRDTLGFYEIDEGEGNAVLASGDTRLVLRAVHSLSAAGRLIYLNLEVGDVQGIYRELIAKGVTFEHPPQVVNHGRKLELWSATFHDPDGHNIAITQWRATR
jgi:catechol 2,3-dioxygenase-like lactoylglutathione lyase family enzyme